MKILMGVTCGVEEADYPSEALIEVDKALAERLLKRRAMFLGLRAYDDATWEIYYMDSTCQFVDQGVNGCQSIGEQLGRDMSGPPLDEDYEVLEGAFLIQYAEARTDCDQTIVSDDGVRFMAYQKHTDFEIRTGEIPWSVIESVVEEAELGEDESDETEDPPALGPILLVEATDIWEIAFTGTIELPGDMDNSPHEVVDYWTGRLGDHDDRVLDRAYDRGSREVNNRRWESYLRVFVKVAEISDPISWLDEVRFGSTWVARVEVTEGPFRRTLDAGYREGEMFDRPLRAGFEVGGQRCCVACLSPEARESVTDQHEITEGEKFRCEVCHGTFVVPPEGEVSS